MYKTIKEMDNNTLIVKYKSEEEEIMEINKSGIVVLAKNALLNYTKAILPFLWQIHEYFSNGRPNRK